MIQFTIVITSDDFPGLREGEGAFCIGQTVLPMWWHCLAAPPVTEINTILWCFREGKRMKGLKHRPANWAVKESAPLPTEGVVSQKWLFKAMWGYKWDQNRHLGFDYCGTAGKGTRQIFRLLFSSSSITATYTDHRTRIQTSLSCAWAKTLSVSSSEA